MKRLTIFAAALALALPATAQTSSRANLENALPMWGFKDVNVQQLSSVQVAHINHLIYSNKSPSQIKGNIGAILGDSIISKLRGRQ